MVSANGAVTAPNGTIPDTAAHRGQRRFGNVLVVKEDASGILVESKKSGKQSALSCKPQQHQPKEGKTSKYATINVQLSIISYQPFEYFRIHFVLIFVFFSFFPFPFPPLQPTSPGAADDGDVGASGNGDADSIKNLCG